MLGAGDSMVDVALRALVAELRGAYLGPAIPQGYLRAIEIGFGVLEAEVLPNFRIYFN